MAKKTTEVTVAQLTENGAYQYPWVSKVTGVATFTASFNTCYFKERTFKKIKGGEKRGNYRSEDDGEIYRIWQHRQ